MTTDADKRGDTQDKYNDVVEATINGSKVDCALTSEIENSDDFVFSVINCILLIVPLMAWWSS